MEPRKYERTIFIWLTQILFSWPIIMGECKNWTLSMCKCVPRHTLHYPVCIMPYSWHTSAGNHPSGKLSLLLFSYSQHIHRFSTHIAGNIFTSKTMENESIFCSSLSIQQIRVTRCSLLWMTVYTAQGAFVCVFCLFLYILFVFACAYIVFERITKIVRCEVCNHGCRILQKYQWMIFIQKVGNPNTAFVSVRCGVCNHANAMAIMFSCIIPDIPVDGHNVWGCTKFCMTHKHSHRTIQLFQLIPSMHRIHVMLVVCRPHCASKNKTKTFAYYLFCSWYMADVCRKI